MMKKTIALVLAGGKTGQYGVLTRNRAKGALTFAGHYRIIDFPLSNLKNSQIEQIGIIIQYLPASLIEHVGVGHPWDLHGYGRCMKIMPPFVGVEKTEWYKGTADALYQNLNFVRDLDPDHIVVLSGEHVYHLDFGGVMEAHRDRKADITMVTVDMPPAACRRRFGYVVAGDDGRVSSFAEKPEAPLSTAVSTGIYVFKADVLVELLKTNAGEASHNLAKDILEPAVRELRAFAYPMEGPWEYMENVIDYYDAQMGMLGTDGFAMLRQWGVLTNLEFRGIGFAPPALYGKGAAVRESLVSASCVIEGGVERSILSPGVRVGKGAVVRGCILMHDCVVGEGAVLEGVISDRDSRFGAGCRVGAEPCAGTLDAGLGDLTLVGKAVQVADGAVVPRCRQVPHGAVVAAG